MTWGQRIHVTPPLTHTAPFHKTNMNLFQVVIYAGKPTGYHFFKEFPFPHESLLCYGEWSVQLTNQREHWKCDEKQDTRKIELSLSNEKKAQVTSNKNRFMMTYDAEGQAM